VFVFFSFCLTDCQFDARCFIALLCLERIMKMMMIMPALCVVKSKDERAEDRGKLTAVLSSS